MSKVKVSFTGRFADNQTWHIDEEVTHGQYHLQASLNGQTINLTFENPAEQARYYSGVQLCRTTCTQNNETTPVYVSSLSPTKKPITQTK